MEIKYDRAKGCNVTVKERYDVLKAKVVKRKNDFDAFIQMLEKDSSWLTSPASTKFHLNKEGGSSGKYFCWRCQTLLKLREFFSP